MQKITRIIALSILLTLYVCVPGPGMGYIAGSTWQHFTYMLFHANPFHLAANGYAAWFILARKPLPPALLFSVMYIGAVAASFVAYSVLPTVGFSAPLYVALGILLADRPSRIAYVMVGLSFALSCLLPGVSAALHCVCFALGWLFMGLRIKCLNILYDCKRVDH